MHWSGIDPDAQINCFGWDIKENDKVVSEERFYFRYQKWRDPVNKWPIFGQKLK